MKKNIKKLYSKKEWKSFYNKVISENNFMCSKCNRTNDEVSLQVHHISYYENKKPWEYAINDCVVLCKGCHAVEHGILEPTTGWELIDIYDNENMDNHCERIGCGANIRYEHMAYHPKIGYRIVGSTCIEFLTEADKGLSHNILLAYRKYGKEISKLKNLFKVKKTKYNKDYFTLSYEKSEYNKFSMVIFQNYRNYTIKINYRKSKHEWGDQDFKYSKINLDKIKEIAIWHSTLLIEKSENVGYGIRKIIDTLCENIE